MDSRGEEVSYSALVAASPEALKNPMTGQPFSKNVVYNLLKSECYDDPNDPDDTWTHETRHSQTALRPDIIAHRFRWAKWMQGLNHTVDLYFRHSVWTDICSYILPTTEKRHQEMTQARKGNKKWRSKGSKKVAKDMKGDKARLKQKSFDSVKVWWAPILSRGKLHVEFLGEEFPGEKPAGAAVLVEKVRKAINIRFPSTDQPDTIFVDRGIGFWSNPGGNITPAFKTAVSECEFKTFYGDDGWKQPGKLADLLLHETSVAWIRKKEAVCRMTQPWKETVPEFCTRLRQVVADINAEHDVDGLCRQLPKRLQMLADSAGERLKY